MQSHSNIRYISRENARCERDTFADISSNNKKYLKTSDNSQFRRETTRTVESDYCFTTVVPPFLRRYTCQRQIHKSSGIRWYFRASKKAKQDSLIHGTVDFNIVPFREPLVNASRRSLREIAS